MVTIFSLSCKKCDLKIAEKLLNSLLQGVQQLLAANYLVWDIQGKSLWSENQFERWKQFFVQACLIEWCTVCGNIRVAVNIIWWLATLLCWFAYLCNFTSQALYDYWAAAITWCKGCVKTLQPRINCSGVRIGKHGICILIHVLKSWGQTRWTQICACYALIQKFCTLSS